MTKGLIEKFQQIDALLANAKTICVASHENPDPDAVSSVLTLHNIFKRQNKKSIPYLPDSPSRGISYLPGFFEIQNEIDSLQPDLIICLDYGDFKRLRLPDLADSCKIVTIDHHIESDQRGDVKVIEPHFSSTTEIIYHWLAHKKIPIDTEIATCLLTGIIADSGGFKHVSTSAQTLNIVSELLLTGVSLNKIVRQVLASDKSLRISKAWGEVLSRVELDQLTSMAYSWLSAHDFIRLGVRLVDFEGIANMISSASPKNFGLFLIEYEKGKVKGSLRAEPSGGMSVVKIAKELGGGGHPYAAGFKLEGDLESVLKKVIKLV
ncbi:MAG: bifunctional oligoribonuclease/PAP phosphatase NrnA [Candidatus Nealsonbacteria bacterium]|nr:bifunctional oligoribonuclease/PAP phosphatase NrnA [Candidatus Nealsonbacteria bacterium]